MDPEQLLQDGDLERAREALQAQIRSEPANPDLRIFLFQLLCIGGDWKRALTQLQVAGDLAPATMGTVVVYREAVKCEALRAEVFAGQRSPLIFGDPAQWIALLLEGLKLSARGEIEKSQEIRDRAFDEAPASAGRINGQDFEWIADADVRLGPMLEGIVNGRYYWIPFSNIAEMRMEAPTDLRDIVWMPARLKLTNGGDVAALLPARYPGAEKAEDPKLKLGRRTDWVDCGAGMFIGSGQRMLATDAGEHPLMEVRELTLGGQDLGRNRAGGDG